MFRDKRVRSSALFGPIFVIILLVSLIGFVSKQVKTNQGQKVHIVKTDSPVPQLIRNEKFEVVEVASVEEGQRLIREGKARVVLHFEPMAPSGQTVVEAFLDPKEQRSQITLANVKSILGKKNKEDLEAKLKSKGLPPETAEALKVEQKDVQVGEQGGASDFLVGILPYLIVVWAFYGGMSIASDLVAGEKEKNTLETLLISPARRTLIVLGKFLALATICLLSAMSSLIGLALVAKLHLPGTEEIMKNGLGVSPMAFLITLIVLLPLVSLFASILIAISSFARNPREAQTYLSLCSFVVIMPAMFSQFLGLTDASKELWINAIPILNTANSIRTALLGKADAVAVAITVAVSLALALVALRITVHLFNREEVLVRV
jgi:sodium transport system permease protein